MSLISFQSYYGLFKSTQINIDEINFIKDDKLFVSVGGGIGSGKTFLYNKFIQLPVIDVDNYVIECSNGKYDRSNLSKARQRFRYALNKSLNGNESFVHMGTNCNLNGTKSRLQEAKDNGFTTVLVLIDTKPEIAIEQVKNRTDRNTISEKRILQSYNDSKEVFNQLINDVNLVDFYVHYKR